MSQAFKNALTTQDGRRMLLELKAYAHVLPESLKVGAQHVIAEMELKATAEERAKWKDEPAPVKGRVKRG